MEKICRICGEMKEIIEFHKKKGTPDGYRRECKECVKNIQKKYKEVPDFKEKRKLYDKNRYKKKRDRILERKKEYHVENREKILLQKKEYHSTEKCKTRYKQWRKENKEHLNELQSKYRKENPHTIAWRSILHSALNRLGTKKQGHTIDLLGYSAIQLKEHIEKQFTEGMTWDNHGDWHIDHIKAVTKFDNSEDVRIVCALQNLRPLWATTREIDGIVYEGNLNRSKF